MCNRCNANENIFRLFTLLKNNLKTLEKIKVLHIIKSLGRGGAEMLLPETLRLHNKELFDFHYIYFLPWKNQMAESIRENGGKVSCFSSNGNIQLLLKIRSVSRYVRKHNIQLIHAHLPWAGILARIVGRMTGIPVLYTEHNKLERYHWATRLMNLGTMNLLTKVIAVSEDVSESIHKNKRHLTVPIETIVNGVDIEKFNSDLFNGNAVREKLGIPSDALVVGTIAVFRFQKRLDVWMHLAAKILREIPFVHFIIVGDGPLKNELIATRQALGLKDRVHMPGLEKEVRPYLAAFDLYMMSSIFEGLPVALLEAMAMKIPVIATAAGGIKEVIRHEIDGLLSSVDRPEELVDSAILLLTHIEERMKFGEQGRKRVADYFSINKMVEELEQVYRQAGAP